MRICAVAPTSIEGPCGYGLAARYCSYYVEPPAPPECDSGICFYLVRYSDDEICPSSYAGDFINHLYGLYIFDTCE